MGKEDKFAKDGYTIYVVGKQLQVTEAIRNYVWEKLSRIERIADQIIDITVTLDTQKLENTCSILMNFIHFHVKVKASTDSLYSAIDKATDRLVKLVRRYKTRLQSYRAKHLSAVDVHVNVIEPLYDELKEYNDEIAAQGVNAEEDLLTPHRVVSTETMKIKTWTQDEALMKMEILGEPFLIYRSEEDHKLKLLYRREDRNFGLVQIQ